VQRYEYASTKALARRVLACECATAGLWECCVRGRMIDRVAACRMSEWHVLRAVTVHRQRSTVKPSQRAEGLHSLRQTGGSKGSRA
jgi:hypothetical protein